jgi:type III secretion protein T
MAELFEIYHTFELHLLSLILCLPRAYGFLLSALLFSQSSMTRMGRNGLIIVLCFPLVPVVHGSIDEITLEPGPVILIVAKEFVIGFILGYAVGWIFWAVQSAGALIDNQRGAAIAESIDPLQGHQSSPLGNLFSQAITVYMFITGALLFLVGILYQSFALWPVTSAFPDLTPRFPAFAFSILDYGMRLALVYAAPVVVIMFLAEMSLAMISRFAPQLQVFILAMPIKSGLAIFILILYVGVLFPEAAGERSQAYRFALTFIQHFGGPADRPPSGGADQERGVP